MEVVRQTLDLVRFRRDRHDINLRRHQKAGIKRRRWECRQDRLRAHHDQRSTATLLREHVARRPDGVMELIQSQRRTSPTAAMRSASVSTPANGEP